MDNKPISVKSSSSETLSEREFCNGICRRLNQIFGHASNREVAQRTNCHTETVRRYRKTGQTKASFIAAVSVEYEVSADWLLTGRGNPDQFISHDHQLGDVLQQIAGAIETKLGPDAMSRVMSILNTEHINNTGTTHHRLGSEVSLNGSSSQN